jgi:ribulose 1,5-bisphosphate synthetase/thiazole synthase
VNLTVGQIYKSAVETEVIARADVLVAGGGTAGAVAAIAAARNGADVLLVERRGFLGGMMTGGNAGLTKYIVHEKSQAEYRQVLAELERDPAAVQVIGGLPMEITRRLMDGGAGIGTHGAAGSYVFTSQSEFKYLLLEMMAEAGVRLMLHSLIVDAIVEEGTIRGVVVESKSGRQALLAQTAIDATGDGDVAARAGAPFVVGVAEGDLATQAGTPEGSMQAMGVMFRVGNVDMQRCFEYLLAHRDQSAPQPFALLGLDEAYEAFRRGDMMTINITGIGHRFQIYNTPLSGVFTFCCPHYYGSGLSVEDLTAGEIAMMVEIRKRVSDMKAALPGFEEAVLLDCPEICVRETRHFRGKYVLDIEDILSQRKFADGIGRGCHPIDIQPIPDALKKYPLAHRWSFEIPYRCLLPKAVENLLLAGRCISNTHEASGCTRPTVQCMVTGEAAGTAAAMCVQQDVRPRDLDATRLRERLVAQGVVL